MLMPFPTHSQREKDLWFVCLFRGAAKGAGSLMIFFLAPLWTPPRPPPPAYSCGGAACALNLNEAAGTGLLPGGEVSPRPCPRQANARRLAARLLRTFHGPNTGSRGHDGLIRGAADPLPALFSARQLDSRAVRRRPAWP